MTDLKIGSRVGWRETYTTSGRVLAQITVWGEVTDIIDHPGDIDGFPLNGYYVRVTAQDGRDLFLPTTDLTTIAKV